MAGGGKYGWIGNPCGPFHFTPITKITQNENMTINTTYYKPLQGTGKSTILEQLANEPIFPRNRRFCTRMAIHLRLRRDPEVCSSEMTLCDVLPISGRAFPGEMVVGGIIALQ